MKTPPDTIEITDDGHTLPVMDVMTGRGFITGKSGSGKSNSASVIAEELLESGLTVVIIDTDGEYFGLKQEYELLHVGGDETCDVQVGVEHGERLARIAIEANVPIIIDVSAYLDPDDAEALIQSVLRQLFVREKTEKKPLLVFLEEVHEFIPEQGGLGELGETILQVAKRGRKRGLGLCAMSQRPAAVDKDFITQCNWIVWHRLTWETDTQVVGRIMDPKYGESVQTLDDGEAFLLTDWDETVQRLRFRRKKTFDAGATPGLEEYNPPDMRSVRSEIIDGLQSIGDTETQTPEEPVPEPDEEADSEEESEPTPSEDEDEPVADEQPDTEEADQTEEVGEDPLDFLDKVRPDGTGPDSTPSASKKTTSKPASSPDPPAPKTNPADNMAAEFAFLVAHAMDRFIARLSHVGRWFRQLFSIGTGPSEADRLEYTREPDRAPYVPSKRLIGLLAVVLALVALGVWLVV